MNDTADQAHEEAALAAIRKAREADIAYWMRVGVLPREEGPK